MMKQIDANQLKYLIIICISCMAFSIKTNAQVSTKDNIMIGAEVFIEPGQRAEDIDTWFRLLKENGLVITRIRMFENYMHKPDGSWDFSLFDKAFEAADKYGIKVYANLFPYTTFDDVGGFKFPKTQSHLDSIANYIKNVALHFKKFKSLYGWVPINEPGGEVAKDEFYKLQYNQWLKNKNPETYNSKGFAHFDFNEYKFVVDYTNWFLQWLVDEINKYDPGKPMHVNNHQLFRWVSQYDFVAWRKFLTSLGGSAHASWHFSYFTRNNYGYAIAANSEILRSGAGELPWFLTEIQGGNNVYSGFHPLCPTPEEIAQWLWIPIGAGSKGGMFWSLNPRASGVEAGEWAMLDFRNHTTDRLLAAADVAKAIHQNEKLFAAAKPAPSRIFIAYTRESLWVEEKLIGAIVDNVYEARRPGGAMKSAIGYFEALSRMGLQPAFGALGEFDFSKNNYTGQTIILAHQVSIPSRYWQPLKDFVKNGGQLIVDGLTAYYDENAVNLMQQVFPLADVLGAEVKEFKMEADIFQLQANGISLPAHGWKGFLQLTTGKVFIADGNNIHAVKNNFGKGKSLWIPELLGLGARISNNYHPLVALLNNELQLRNEIRFAQAHDGVLMKVLHSGNSIITILVNKYTAPQHIVLEGLQNKKPQILFQNKKGSVNDNAIHIDSEETIVVHWK